MTHALTIDLEDWHQLLHRRATGALIPPNASVVRATERLLDVLDEADVRATFFTVGMLAEHYPALVKEVARRGHEIASHSYTHRLISSMTRAEFKEEMLRSMGQLESLTGKAVRGFRAPEFSVGNLRHWCFEVLAEVGIEYDSSVFPLPKARYGIAGAPSEPFDIDTPAGRIREFPLATWRSFGVTLPVAGGTYYRLLPTILLRRAMRQLDGSGRTIVLYFHPYEFYDGWLWLSSLSWRQRLRPAMAKYTVLHNLFTASILERLRPILNTLDFVPLGEMERNAIA